jgi:hypothetical protein
VNEAQAVKIRQDILYVDGIADFEHQLADRPGSRVLGVDESAVDARLNVPQDIWTGCFCVAGSPQT